MNNLIDGSALAASIRAQLRVRVTALARPPGLAVIVVGDNPASAVYVRNKIRACAEVGVMSERVALPADISQSALHEYIDELNQRSDIDGILVQMPLPALIDARLAIDRVAPHKDVDGLHSANLGALLSGRPQFVACTAAGVIALIESTGRTIRGQVATVVGASAVVGKPAALLLLSRGATVTLCNSSTRDLAAHTRAADILVVAVGRPGLISADMVKPGAIVIDVGINRLADGRLAGDVDFASVAALAGMITPVPGGVGPMTVAMLVANTVTAAEQSIARTTQTQATS